QAEDGIRDRNVTGVQTCALPILVSYHFVTGSMPFQPGSDRSPSIVIGPLARWMVRGGPGWGAAASVRRGARAARRTKKRTRTRRSEERRVGKEGRRGGGGAEEKE